MAAYSRLIEELGELGSLSQIGSILSWDQETLMPPRGIGDRAKQLSLLSTLIHRRATSDTLKGLIEEAEKEELDEYQRSIVRETKRDYEKAVTLPESLVKEIAETRPKAIEAWSKAKQDDDFPLFAPLLEKVLDQQISVAECYGYEDTPYDAALDQYEPHLLTRDVKVVFAELRERYVPLVKRILDGVEEDYDAPFAGMQFPSSKQMDLSRTLIKGIGYDLEGGRLDLSRHPFTTGSNGDVRVTTWVDETCLKPSIFASVHEAGHGMYVQGHLEKYWNTPLGEVASLSLHESQSRLWENIIGRSRGFWHHYWPEVVSTFPAMEEKGMEAWYRHVNSVKRSYIRVEADEVTYNLHILLRFEIEQRMIGGNIDISEIPHVWNDLMEKYVGIRPQNDTQGCLQDIHWSMSSMGYFPTYALGNLLTAQIFDSARKAMPDLETDISTGQFSPLLDWLRSEIHQYGRMYTFPEMTQRVTGQPLKVDFFINYIKEKYGELYGLSL